MSKTNAGERKRTVTVTVGDITSTLVKELQAKMDKAPGMTHVSLTTIAGVGLNMVLAEWCEAWGIPIPKDYHGHGS